MGLDMMEIMSKLPAIMGIFGHIEDFKLEQKENKYSVTITFKDKSKAYGIIQMNLDSKEQQAMVEEIKGLIQK